MILDSLENLTRGLETATSSDIFLGGLALGSIGAALALIRKTWISAKSLIRRRLALEITIDNRSPNYRHFWLWAEKNNVFGRSRRLRDTGIGEQNEKHSFVPTTGSHWFFHAGKFGTINRTMEDKSKLGTAYSSKFLETLTLSVFACSKTEVQSWLEEGRAIAQAQDTQSPSLWSLQNDWWDNVGTLRRRALSTLIVDDDRIEKLVADLRQFYGAEKWYDDRGVPWRRGYLLHGPPGTGKSSVIRAIASEMSLDVASLDIGRIGLSDESLRQGICNAPKNALIIIEDVDAIFRGRESGEKSTGVSFSGLLNAIDGVGAQEGRALIMTTNHREKLDPALIRPGRVDVNVELGAVRAQTAGQLFRRFFPEHAELEARFVNALGERRHTPARLQAWLLENAHDVERAAGACELVKHQLISNKVA